MGINVRSLAHKILNLEVKTGAPSQGEGSEGSMTIRWVPNQGLYLFIKYGNRWYSRLFNEKALTISDEMSKTVVSVSESSYNTISSEIVNVRGNLNHTGSNLTLPSSSIDRGWLKSEHNHLGFGVVTDNANSTVDTEDILLGNSILLSGTAGELIFAAEGGSGQFQIGFENDVTIPNDLTVTNDLTVSGTNTVLNTNLTVSGETTSINSTDTEMEDHTLTLGAVATPTDTTADGGGIILEGDTEKTIAWTKTTDAWHFNQGINITSGDMGIGTDSPGTELEVRIAAGSGARVGSTENDYLTLGEEAYSTDTAYIGLKTAYQSGANDYMILSGKTVGHTFISAKDGDAVYIRGGGNDTGNEITVYDSATTDRIDFDTTTAYFTGDVGIGASGGWESNVKLDVQGGHINVNAVGYHYQVQHDSDTGSSRSTFRIEKDGDDSWTWWHDYDSTDLNLASALGGDFSITGIGKVGIGTTAPASKLDVNSGTTDYVANFESTDAGAYINIKDSTGQVLLKTQNAGDFHIETDHDTNGSYDSRMTILGDSGNVGIGDNDPSEKLSVSGNISASPSSGTGKAAIIASSSDQPQLSLVSGTDTEKMDLKVNTDASKTTVDIQPISGLGRTKWVYFGTDSDSVNLGVSDLNTSLFTGTGWGIKNDGNKSSLYIDDLWVRGTLTVWELVINQIRATNGSLFVTSAAKITDVTYTGTSSDPIAENDTLRLTVEGDDDTSYHPFASDDLIMCRDIEVGPGGAADGENAIETIEVRMEVTDNNPTTDLRQFDVKVSAGSSSVNASQLISKAFVRIGSTTDEDRQGGIYLTSDDADSPFIDVYDGVGSWADWQQPGMVKSRIGRIDGVSGATNEFGIMAGEGFTVGTHSFLKASNQGVSLYNTPLQLFSGDTRKITATAGDITYDYNATKYLYDDRDTTGNCNSSGTGKDGAWAIYDNYTAGGVYATGGIGNSANFVNAKAMQISRKVSSEDATNPNANIASVWSAVAVNDHIRCYISSGLWFEFNVTGIGTCTQSTQVHHFQIELVYAVSTAGHETWTTDEGNGEPLYFSAMYADAGYPYIAIGSDVVDGTWSGSNKGILFAQGDDGTVTFDMGQANGNYIKWQSNTGVLSIKGDVEVTNPADYAPQTLYDSFTNTSGTDDNKWAYHQTSISRVETTDDGVTCNLAKIRPSTSNDSWAHGILSAQVFQRSNEPVIEFNVLCNNFYPATFIGFVPKGTSQSDIETHPNYYHLLHSVYFQEGKIRTFYDGDGTNQPTYTDVLASAWNSGEDTWFRVRLKAKKGGGSYIEVWKNGDFSSPVATFAPEDEDNSEELRVVIITHYGAQTARYLLMDNLSVGGSSFTGTRISGNTIRTGNIQSNNYTENAGSVTAGTQISLDDGAIDTQYFQVSSSGNITATGGDIAGWKLDSESITSPDWSNAISSNQSGIGIKIASEGSDSGSRVYNGAQVLEGITSVWHRGGNAGHLVFGQLTEINDPHPAVKTGYVGIQMAAWAGEDSPMKEYFALSAQTDTDQGGVYNRIAGWEFTEDYLRKETGTYKVELRSDEYSIRVWKNSDSSHLVAMGQQYYKNGWQDFGFSYTSDYNNTEHEPEFMMGSGGNRIAGWTFDGDAIYTGDKDTSGYTASGITISSASGGSIHAKKFYIDTSGNAFFKGNLTGADITGASGTFSGTVQVGGTTLNTSNTLNENTTAGDVGLGNVTNASQATIQAATLLAADADDVGLGNVDNTSDASVLSSAATASNSQDKTGGSVGGLTLASNKMYIGTGTYNNANTAFYVDNSGKMSLKDKLYWNGTTLAITGEVHATSGSFTSNVTIGGTSASTVVDGAAAGATANQDSTATILGGNLTGTVDGTAVGTIKSGAASGATANQDSTATILSGNLTGSVDGTAVATIESGAAAGATAVQDADLGASGTTTIDGGRILTGLIDASYIDTLNMSLEGSIFIDSDDGTENVCIGKWAQGTPDKTGTSQNVIIGVEAGQNITTGDNNVFIGTGTGFNVTAGSGNVAIGSAYMFGNNDTGKVVIGGNQSGGAVYFKASGSPGEVTLGNGTFPTGLASLECNNITNNDISCNEIDANGSISGASYEPQYESSWFQLANGSTEYEWTHGLGSVPRIVRVIGKVGSGGTTYYPIETQFYLQKGGSYNGYWCGCSLKMTSTKITIGRVSNGLVLFYYGGSSGYTVAVEPYIKIYAWK